MLEGLVGSAGSELIQHLVLLHDLIHALQASPRALWVARAVPASSRHPPGFCDRFRTPPMLRIGAPWCGGPNAGQSRGPAHVAPGCVGGIPSRHSGIREDGDPHVGHAFGRRAIRLPPTPAGGRPRKGVPGRVPIRLRRAGYLVHPRHLPDPRDRDFLERARRRSRPSGTDRRRALVLFTSVEAMETTHRLLQGILPFPLMVQARPRARNCWTAFAAMLPPCCWPPRSFWQGVDVVGRR